MEEHTKVPVIARSAKISLGVFLIISVMMLNTGCTALKLFSHQPTAKYLLQPPAVTDSSLAGALLNLTDVQKITGLEQARPELIELNHHLDSTAPNYNFYVAQSWYNRPSSTILLQNAITQYQDESAAQQAITDYAKDYTILPTEHLFGDTAIIYYRSSQDDIPAMLTYRLTLNHYSAKIQLYNTGDKTLSDADIQANLLPLAYHTAKVQAAKLKAFLQGTYTPPAANTAMQKLPTTLTNTTYIGQVPVTDQEWLGVSFDMERNALTGYHSGGLSRFELIDQPEQVVEVVIMEFDKPKHARAFQAELKTGINNINTTKIDVPADLPAKQVDAINRSGLVELQALKGRYVIDVAMFAPFSDTEELSHETLINLSREVLKNFKPLAP